MDFDVPHTALVFWNPAMGFTPWNLRSVLLDDEKGDSGAEAKKVCEGGFHVLSTFRWTGRAKVARL